MTHSSELSRIRCAVETATAFALLVIFCSYISLERFVARDEGFYLFAGSLVMEGQTLYRDFFYPQMPLLPYVYGVWMRIVGFDWHSGRLLSAFFTAGLGTLLFHHVRTKIGGRSAIAATLLFAGSVLIIAFFSTAKTYALSTLLLFGAFLLVEDERSTTRAIAIGGLLVGLTIATRLTLAATVPLFFLMALRVQRGERQFVRALYFVAGGVLSTFPFLPLVFGDLDQFWFNNVGYHTDRSSYTDEQAYDQRIKLLTYLLGTRPSSQDESIQLPLLLAATVGWGLYVLIRKRRIDYATAFALTLIGVSFLPRPTYTQYVVSAVPFMILAAVRGFHALGLDESRFGFRSALQSGAVVAFSFCYLAGTPLGIKSYTETGRGVIGIQEERHALPWKIESIEAVTAAIDSRIEEGARVFSTWPGYLLGSKGTPVHGLENHFALTFSRKFGPSADRFTRYHILSSEALIRDFRNNPPAVVVGYRKVPRFVSSVAKSEGYVEIDPVYGHVLLVAPSR